MDDIRDEEENNESSKVQLNKYPPSIKYIMGNEACERFSFYGLRAVLELYFINNLMLTDNQATLCMHTFIFFAYFCTIPGGFLSDTYLGKYKTILYVSFIYCIGSGVLSVSAIPPTLIGTFFGLFLVAVGTGGIKACVSAFVGDQFIKGQEDLLEKVFGLFYFCINLGSFFSTIITPMLREYLAPSIAFALPAFLLLVATAIFWSGRKQYRMIPPGGSILRDVYIVSRDATTGWLYDIKIRNPDRQSFWSYAKLKHPSKLVDDIRITVNVLKVFLFLPMFWSLFDQHGSRWVLQAEQMNKSFYFFRVTADQMPTLNPLFTLSLIPVFQFIFYPTAQKIIGKPLKPLEHKMVFGMLLTGFAFILSGILQIAIDNSPPESVHISAQIPQYFILSCGEIMVSVTGLDVAYSQAPTSMKTIVMAGWQMTVAIGNLIVAVIAAINWPKELVTNFFMYAFLMFVFDFAFFLYVRGYEYRVDSLADIDDIIIKQDSDDNIPIEMDELDDDIKIKTEEDDENE